MLETCAAINPGLKAFQNALAAIQDEPKLVSAATIKAILSRAPRFKVALLQTHINIEFKVPSVLGKRTVEATI